MSSENYRNIEFSRFMTSQKLALLLLEHKDLSKYSPEELAEEFVEVTTKIDRIISTANFS